ncbi:UNVERIFIED_CONTAM: hypothetical protein GTU68_044506 [Idotea baltica]|nr:hypothetical protein [Idotea baltica]
MYLFFSLCERIYYFLSYASLELKSFNIYICNKLFEEKPSLNDIQILYWSKHFVVVNKRYDVLINSNNIKDKVTVQTQLKRLCPELANPKLGHEFNFVHRLDYSTSGILCLATDKTSCKYASLAFQKRTVDKYYLAIVRGHVSHDFFEINVGIGEDTRLEFQNIRMALEGSAHVFKPRSASTKLLVLERGISHDFPATKVLLKPTTGRRHQLRLHMSALGHTIVGDFTYSNRHDVTPFRMFLHAFRLVLPTPLETLDVQTEDPFGEMNKRNRWCCVEVLNTLDKDAFSKIKEDPPLTIQLR